MNTHTIICTRGRDSFCCTLLACQSIKIRMIFQGIIREARLFAHTSVLMQVKGEETRREACLLWHITFSPSPSIACWVIESWCLYAAGRGWGVRCAILAGACFRFLHHQFYSQITEFCWKPHEWFQSECHTSVIKERE